MPKEPVAPNKPQQARRPELNLVRHEAEPVNWKRLTQDQRRAAVKIHKWLVEFVGEPIPKPPRQGHRSPFEYQEIIRSHPSNIILIDGGRGSGKTSILVTLLDLWRQVAAGAKLRDLMPPEVSEKPSKSRPKPKPSLRKWAQLIEQLDGPLRGKLVPIRILDVQPLPWATSLLAWIATRILELVDHLDAPSGRRAGAEPAKPIASWEPNWERELPSRRAFNKLMQCAALGWSSNLPARKGTLDPNSYAVELNEAEQARLAMVDSWREFISAVIADANRLYPELIHEDARLIIPVDDADMNPHHCVELLELVRALWSPRVVFVVTGHSELFLKMLQLHFYRALQQPLQGAGTSPKGEDSIEAASHPNTLALQLYDKIIPVQHRFALPPLEGAERLKRMQNVLTGSLRRNWRELHLPPVDLSGYFRLSPQLQQGLPDRLRRILNLQQALKETRTACEQVHQLWGEAVDNSALSHEQQAALRRIVQLDSRGALRVAVQGRFTPTTRQISPRPLGLGNSSLQVNIVTGYTFTFSAPEQEGRSFTLPTDLGALLELASNVAADDERSDFSSLHPAPTGVLYPLSG